MLYPKNREDRLSAELFRDPSAEYRCTPFWAWNCDLDDGLLNREIDYMKEMGMGGFHMHVRVGMSTPYLSDEFMGHIRNCIDKAKANNMLAWLYDEDKWPSGFAGGLVTKDEENRMKYLLFTPLSNEEAAALGPDAPGISGKRTGKGKLIASYDIILDNAGKLASYRRIGPEDKTRGKKWYAYMEATASSPWYNLQGYVDTMSPGAIRRFIDITHEKYLEKVGDEFGKSIPAIFTDEPQMICQTTLAHAKDAQDVVLAWTPDFDDTYKARYGESVLDTLPEVVWEVAGGISKTRYRYHDHATERFVGAYCDQIGEWCRQHGILMTGHMLREETLHSQSSSVGECMRAYRRFGLPGVDMLCDRREFSTVKQAASAAHQYGCPGVLSELYGVTNWDFDFRGHKLQGDWQACLGVSVRVPHLYWVSMHGEAKRDYPASIGHQSAWYREYPFIEDHFARVNTAMTRGKARVRIGVIHPVETYWVHYGPEDQTGADRKDIDTRFDEITKWLLFNTLDFDYICESTLPELYQPGGKKFRLGEMAYDTVVVPSCDTLRGTTLEALRKFREDGGKVIFMGDIARYSDGVPSGAARELAEKCLRIGWNRSSLLSALEEDRDIEVRADDGLPSSNIFAALREDGEDRELFLVHVWPTSRVKVDRQEHYRVTLRGEWKPQLLDTMTGAMRFVGAAYEGGDTVFTWDCYPQDSLLLRLEPGRAEADAPALTQADAPAAYTYLPDEASYTLSEKNVCLIDMAKWRVDEGEWQPREEMLRIGKYAKEALGMSTATIGGAQPWVLPKEKPVHTITLESEIVSEIEDVDVSLALEDLTVCDITFNGVNIPREDLGCYVDDSIRTVRLPGLKKGVNTLRVKKPFSVTTDTENMFLLGDFGVRAVGSSITVIEKPERLRFGDWTGQGIPFYGGSVTYHFDVEGGSRKKLRLGLFAAPCVTAELDGKRIANVSLAPYEADLGELAPGTHSLDITVWASRVNTFGTFHLSDHVLDWFGPRAWRTEGEDWTYDYRLTPSGLLTEPRLISY